MVGGLFDVLEGLVALLKFGLFPFLGGKGLDDPLAQQAVLNGSIQLADLKPLTPESCPQLVIQPDGDNSHYRHTGKDNQGQGDAGGAENHKGRHNLDGGDEKLLGAVMGKLGHIKQVVGDAAHDLAHLGVGIVGVTEALQMGKGIPAHVGFNVDAHDVAVGSHVIVGRTVDQPQHQIQGGQFQHDACRQGNGGVGGGVGQVAHDLGQHNVAQGRQCSTDQVENQDALVPHQIGQKPYQLGFLPGFGLVCHDFLRN